MVLVESVESRSCRALRVSCSCALLLPTLHQHARLFSFSMLSQSDVTSHSLLHDLPAYCYTRADSPPSTNQCSKLPCKNCWKFDENLAALTGEYVPCITTPTLGTGSFETFTASAGAVFTPTPPPVVRSAHVAFGSPPCRIHSVAGSDLLFTHLLFTHLLFTHLKHV